MNNRKNNYPTADDIRTAIMNPSQSNLEPEILLSLKQQIAACYIISQNNDLPKAIRTLQARFPELSDKKAEIYLRCAAATIEATNKSEALENYNMIIEEIIGSVI
ncbi:MAG: hypothetical protein HOD37_06885 [Bacteroidetes bacterium]|jgi:hypothetical protein|nr:hypothetical protein [Bacteroidota bacterium]